MSGTTGERPFSDILTSIRYYNHSITILLHYLLWVVIYQYRFSVWRFGTPRQMNTSEDRQEAPLISDRFNALAQVKSLSS
jgi:photosystem II cytochrome b559 subunit alpha